MPDWLIIAGAIGGLITTWLGILLVIHQGIKAFQSWFKADVIEPYIKPLTTDIRTMRNEQEIDRRMLLQHDKYIYVLLGKTLGGIPDLSEDK